MFEHEIMTAGELLDKQLPSKPIVVEGMLPTGTYILAGTPKIGKSFFATQLCWSVAEGVPFLGIIISVTFFRLLHIHDNHSSLLKIRSHTGEHAVEIRRYHYLQKRPKTQAADK